jgi:hypothetical protein
MNLPKWFMYLLLVINNDERSCVLDYRVLDAWKKLKGMERGKSSD